MKPNYKENGSSNSMGPKIKSLVEKQLVEDLTHYGIIESQYRFDWSESCIEGHDTEYLDGVVENFSGIKIFNQKDEYIAEGWMEYIHESSQNIFLVYWEFLNHYRSGKEIVIKESVGIPLHIFYKLPKKLQYKYQTEILK
ncbi:hypothetical protein [Paucisalibacillus globulus]|uniref:hypothetical protein n=1 Tax=Paucisalibacillus globulus TaxID=351095 RepID=UPI000401D543|nr:hypothetical protein [Paucisalibacillus globulus]